MAQCRRPEEAEEGVDEARRGQERRAVAAVRVPRTLMLRRMESQPRRRLEVEARRKPQARPRPRVEQVPLADRA